MKQLEYARQTALLRPHAPASWMTNAELYDILLQLAELRDAVEIMRGEAEPHPIEEAVEVEQAIDAQLPYTRVFNPYLNGSVRPENSVINCHVATVDLTKNFNGIKATATATWAERHLNKEADAA